MYDDDDDDDDDMWQWPRQTTCGNSPRDFVRWQVSVRIEETRVHIGNFPPDARRTTPLIIRLFTYLLQNSYENFTMKIRLNNKTCKNRIDSKNRRNNVVSFSSHRGKAPRGV